MASDPSFVDSRGYFMLPQTPEDAGYYVYGTPGKGAAQYAHPATISVLMFVEREWQRIDDRKFGVGNISLAGGAETDHSSHRDGLQVDIRPLRLDGQQVGVTWRQSAYDKEGTTKLIELFRSHPLVKKIYFNDLSIPGVKYWSKHDNHLHVELRETE